MDTIMQGDSYDIAITLTDDAGEIITEAAVEDVVITVGSLSKSYSDGAVTYSDGKWIFPLEQRETFCMRGNLPFEVRVKFNSGEVVGAELTALTAKCSINKEML